MSDSSPVTNIEAHGGGTRLRGRMVARSPHEGHRAATPLELSSISSSLSPSPRQRRAAPRRSRSPTSWPASLGYLDGLLRDLVGVDELHVVRLRVRLRRRALPLAVFAQISGALIMAAGVPAMFESRMPNIATVAGYVVMRLAAVAQWLRAAASDPERRTTARRYAVGIRPFSWRGSPCSSCPLWMPGFLALAALELPCRCGPSAPHPPRGTRITSPSDTAC